MIERNRVYDAAIEEFGEEMQLMVAVEELAELQKEVIKHLRGIGIKPNMIEEIADVEIMLEQMKMMLEIKETEVEKVKEYKINRLMERLL